MAAWEFERSGEIVTVDPTGQMIVGPEGAMDLLIAAALAGLGMIYLFEEWLAPYLASGALAPVRTVVAAVFRAISLLPRRQIGASAAESLPHYQFNNVGIW
jgi:DNA-binding transcriptional LysR family regulator